MVLQSGHIARLVLRSSILLLTAISSFALASGRVVINEFMAANDSVLADPQGQFDDWVELYNPGDGPVNVADMYMTDNLERPDEVADPGRSGGPHNHTGERVPYRLARQ